MIALLKDELQLPPQVEYCLDTLWVMRHATYRDKVSWHDKDDDYWTIFTDTGAKSLCVPAVVNWIVSEGGLYPAKTFASECGDEHDATADAMGAALMVMPGDYGIFDIVTKYQVLPLTLASPAPAPVLELAPVPTPASAPTPAPPPAPTPSP